MHIAEREIQTLIDRITFVAKEISELDKESDPFLSTYITDLRPWLERINGTVHELSDDYEMFREIVHFDEDKALSDEAERGLLTALLRSISQTSSHFALTIDSVVPLLHVWRSQSELRSVSKSRDALLRFSETIMRKNDLHEKVILIVGEPTPSCSPFPWGDVTRHILFMPYSETVQMSRWVLLGHEIGHIYYDTNFDVFNSVVVPRVLRELVENAPLHISTRDLSDASYIWSSHWIPELACDSFAAKTFGPAYVSQFLAYCLSEVPFDSTSTHPHPELRVKLMFEILQGLQLDGFDVNELESKWESYTRSVSLRSSTLLTNDDVFRAASEGIRSVMRNSPILQSWPNLELAKDSLNRGVVPKVDLFDLIASLALAEPTHSVMQAVEQYLDGNSFDLEVS